MRTILFLILLTLSFIYTSYSDEASDLVADVLKEYKKVESYEAEMSVKVDVDYLNAPEKKGKISYTKEKTKIDIPGFSMLPKQGTGNFIGEILSLKNSYIYIGKEKIDNENLEHIKVIPNNSKDIVLVDMFIDGAKDIVKKADISTKENGTFSVKLNYKSFSGFLMPSQVIIDFLVPSFKMPKVLVGPRDEKRVKKIQNDGENTKGKVILKYWNYTFPKIK